MIIRLLATIGILSSCYGVEVEDPKPDQKPPAEAIRQDDFSKSGNATDPLDPENRCFRIGELDLPVEGLPKNRKLVLKLRLYCEQFGGPPDRDPKGPGRLQLDVTRKNGNRMIGQRQFPVGKEWIDFEINFKVFESTASIVVYNKWTEMPIFVDDLRVELAPEEK